MATSREPDPVEKRRDRDDDLVLPDVTGDERDGGWGDDPRAGRRDDEWYRRERPPHHGG